MPQPSLFISKTVSYIDEKLTIKVINCPANQEFTIRVLADDDQGKNFASYAVFQADEKGEVEVSHTIPIQGTYSSADASGLFWSVERTDADPRDYFEKTTATPLTFVLQLEIDGEIADQVSLTRYFYDKEKINRVSICDSSFNGILFHPQNHMSHHGIILLGGSDGGVQEHAAALLASKGYSVLALAYFGVEGVPRDLEEIPLEYFQGATSWLKEHPSTNGGVSLIGYSRGGELALLLGAVFNDYQTIIAGAPSSYVTSGLKNTIFAPIPAWTYKEQSLPYMKFVYRPSTIFSIWKNWLLKRPVSFLSIWDHTLKNEEKIASSRIPVEMINVPVMTVSGDDDQLWPSTYYSREIAKNLAVSETVDNNQHLYFEEAGHFLTFPYSLPNMPANVHMQVGGRMTMTFGGSKAANAKAAKETWPKLLAFLKEHTK